MLNIRDASIIDKNCIIGKNSKIWHWSHVSKNSKIGSNCTIGQNVFIGENVKIGNNVKIQNNVSIYQGVTIENDVFCGPSVVFTNIAKPRSEFPQNETKLYQKTLVSNVSTQENHWYQEKYEMIKNIIKLKLNIGKKIYYEK